MKDIHLSGGFFTSAAPVVRSFASPLGLGQSHHFIFLLSRARTHTVFTGAKLAAEPRVKMVIRGATRRGGR